MTTKTTGKDQIIAALKSLPAGLRGEASRKAVRAGAKVIEQAWKAAAPPRSSQNREGWQHIQDSVIISEKKSKDTYLKSESDSATTLRIGISKKAPQAWWYEKGRKGFSLRGTINDKGKRKTLHWSKGGTELFRKSAKVGPQAERKTFMPAFESAKAEAFEAIKQTLSEYISKAARR